MQGKIVEWNDQKGYGFIAPVNGEQAVFLHISAIKNRRVRPRLKNKVCFEVSRDRNKRLNAINVVLINRKLPSLTVLFACSYLVFASAAVFLRNAPIWLIPVYLGLSVFTFLVYAWDKRAAQKGKWRTSENTLHFLALFGGWPGALLAQHTLRHKSRKQPFKAILWITIAMNCSAFICSFTPSGTLFLQQVINYIPVLER